MPPEEGSLEDPFDTGDIFVYETVGLTSAEADKRFQQFGPNELPEKIIPKWLVCAMHDMICKTDYMLSVMLSHLLLVVCVVFVYL